MEPNDERPDLTDEITRPDIEASMASIPCPETYQILNVVAVMSKVEELLRQHEETVIETVAFVTRSEQELLELEQWRASRPGRT